MALLWIEGFETYDKVQNANITVPLGYRYTVSGTGTPVLDHTSTADYWDCYSLNVSTDVALLTPVLTTNDTLIIGLRLWTSSTTSGTYTFLNLYDGSTLGVYFYWNAGTREIQVFRGTGAVLLGTTSGAALKSGDWQYVEVKVKCNGATGTVEVKIEGVTKLSLTNQNTKAGSDNYHNRVDLHVAYRHTLDDIYICDASGSVNNNYLGRQKVKALVPAADTTNLDWTPSGSPHYLQVRDIPCDVDVSYVGTSDVGAVDLYYYTGIQAAGQINGIQVRTICRQTDANPFNLQTVVESGVTRSLDTAQSVGVQSYTERSRVLETDPNTGQPWTLAALNNTKFGVKTG